MAFLELCEVMKKKLSAILLLCCCLSVTAQKPTSVAEIKGFYQDVNLDCYRKMLQNGMDEFDRWLVDTLYKKTSIGILFKPADINLAECSLEYFVPLRFFDMASFSAGDDIYEHLIIDSTLCISFIPLDKRGMPIGVTDFDLQPYSFYSFQKEKRNVYRDSRVRGKYARKFLKYAHKYESEANVQVTLGLHNFYGYINQGKIYLVTRQRRPVELSVIIHDILSFGGLDLDMLRDSDRIHLPTYRGKWGDGYDGRGWWRSVGNTPENEKRLCYE